MSRIQKIWDEYELGKIKKLDPAFEIALGEYGIKEISGPNHNPEILKYFSESGFPTILDDETSWCSAFMNWCQIKAGRPGTNSLAARSWMEWGEPVFEPIIGDVAIFWRITPTSWQGHVFFFVKRDGSNVWGLGGNQSNMVNIAPQDGIKLLGYRRYMK